MLAPKDYTKQGILNWIAIQKDDSDMEEIIKMCIKKIHAIKYIREVEARISQQRLRK